MIRPLALLLIVLACTRSDSHVVDTNHVVPDKSFRDMPPATRSMLGSIGRLVMRDTSSDANKQLNLMTAPVSVVLLNGFETDTLQWVARSDSCMMMFRTSGPGGHSWMLVGEGSGTVGPGNNVDISPSPDLTRYAYTFDVRVPADSAHWKKTEWLPSLSYADLRGAAEPGPAGSQWTRYVAVYPSPEDCMGDAVCTVPLVTVLPGAHRIGWTADNRYLLIADRADSNHWIAVDPSTRQPVPGVTASPHQLNWANRPVTTAMTSMSADGIIGGGPYRFIIRGDSILLRGFDRNGRIVERIVGAGVPVAVTRHGEYLLAVRRDKARIRAVIYELTLFHAMLQSSCDQPR